MMVSRGDMIIFIFRAIVEAMDSWEMGLTLVSFIYTSSIHVSIKPVWLECSHFKTDRTGRQKLNPEGLNETHLRLH